MTSWITSAPLVQICLISGLSEMHTTDPRPRSAEELYTIYLARRQEGKKINDPERLIERKRMKGVN